ncbi:MAG: hypothetical protein U0414_29505 [Polyangiaceae bacterium]
MAAQGFLLALSVVACGTPRGVAPIVVSRETEARVAAMRVRDDAPATVTEIATPAELLEGDEASGQVGDWVLANGSVVAIVADADGSARGGTVVDLVRRSHGVDDLRALETRAFDQPARYTSLASGVDEARGVAWIEVSGRAGEVPISTRYELARGAEALVLHTAVSTAARGSARYACADRLALEPGQPPGHRPPCALDYCSMFGAHEGYLLTPLFGRGTLTEPGDDGAMTVGVEPAATGGGAFVYSRALAPLDRPDSLGVMVALAIQRGAAVGDVELSVTPDEWSPARIIGPGTFVFTPVDTPADVVVELMPRIALHPGDHVTVRAPLGGWRVGFWNPDYRMPAEGSTVDIVADSVARARILPVRRRPSSAASAR